MEIAAGNCFVVIGENNGIVRHGVNLAADGIVNVFDRIAACSVNLRGAAQCICILNLSGNGIKRKLAAFKQSEQVLCAVDLSLVAANSMNLGIIGLLDAEKCFRSHCAGDIRSLCELNGVIYRKTADGSHYLSSVNECKAFLGRKFDSGNPGSRHCFPAAHDFALVFRAAFTEHNKNHVGKGCKVSACAEGALFGNYGVNTGVQH